MTLQALSLDELFTLAEKSSAALNEHVPRLDKLPSEQFVRVFVGIAALEAVYQQPDSLQPAVSEEQFVNAARDAYRRYARGDAPPPPNKPAAQAPVKA